MLVKSHRLKTSGKEQDSSRVKPATGNLVVGIHSVTALLKNHPKKVNQVVFLKNSQNPKLFELQKQAKKLGIKVHQLPKNKLDYYYPKQHQGVIALCHHRTLSDWQTVENKLIKEVQLGQNPKVVFAASIEDPRNLGACIRSSLGFGIDALVIPNKGTCGLTETVAKTSCGASEVLTICQVANSEDFLKAMKQKGFQILGIERDSTQVISKHTYDYPCVLVVGGEDRGIPPHIKRNCEHILSIPIQSKAHSYNASVALSLFLYEMRRQNNFQELT